MTVHFDLLSRGASPRTLRFRVFSRRTLDAILSANGAAGYKMQKDSDTVDGIVGAGPLESDSDVYLVPLTSEHTVLEVSPHRRVPAAPLPPTRTDQRICVSGRPGCAQRSWGLNGSAGPRLLAAPVPLRDSLPSGGSNKAASPTSDPEARRQRRSQQSRGALPTFCFVAEICSTALTPRRACRLSPSLRASSRVLPGPDTCRLLSSSSASSPTCTTSLDSVHGLPPGWRIAQPRLPPAS